jgi:diguanylate cyclase
MIILLSILGAMLAAGGGVGAGLWIATQRRPPAKSTEATTATESLQRLRDLAGSVAAQFDSHAATVQEISASLQQGGETAVVDAVARLLELNQEVQKQLTSAEHRLEEQERQLASSSVEARTDALTKVANRRAFDQELSRAVSELKAAHTPAALLLVDVDHFKRFNDTQGHQAGDAVLAGVAQTLQQQAGNQGLVARFGGEEFAVLYSGLAQQEAVALAERARAAIAAAPYQFGGKSLRVTASGGVAELGSGECEQDLIQRADVALYASKKAGRNCGHWHDGEKCIKIEAHLGSQLPVASGGNDLLGEFTNFLESRDHDPLAGVSSRIDFFEDLTRRFAHFRRFAGKSQSVSLSLLLLQVDGLSQTTQERGPDISKRMVEIAAKLMKAAMRDMDHLARLSEDVFGLLLPGARLPDTSSIGERVRAAVERCRTPMFPSGFTVSVGCVEALPQDDTRKFVDRCKASLDAAMLHGRNCTFYHDGEAVRLAVGGQVVVRS